jgi:hypothetical protein
MILRIPSFNVATVLRSPSLLVVSGATVGKLTSGRKLKRIVAKQWEIVSWIDKQILGSGKKLTIKQIHHP